jgi:hypothetical protein
LVYLGEYYWKGMVGGKWKPTTKLLHCFPVLTPLAQAYSYRNRWAS